MDILKFEIWIVRVLVSVPTPLVGEFEAEPQAIRTHTSHMHTDTHCRVHTCTQTDFYTVRPYGTSSNGCTAPLIGLKIVVGWERGLRV